MSALLLDCMLYSENDAVFTGEDVQVCIICYVLPVALHLMLLYQERMGEEGELTGGHPAILQLFDLAGIVSTLNIDLEVLMPYCRSSAVRGGVESASEQEAAALVFKRPHDGSGSACSSGFDWHWSVRVSFDSSHFWGRHAQ